jgi:hypothetical protein
VNVDGCKISILPNQNLKGSVKAERFEPYISLAGPGTGRALLTGLLGGGGGSFPSCRSGVRDSSPAKVFEDRNFVRGPLGAPSRRNFQEEFENLRK